MSTSACCWFEEGKRKRFVRCAAEFISFDKRQKKRTKEKRFPRRSNPIDSLLSGFFDSPSMARSKNGAHPVRRPSGLSLTQSLGDFSEQKATKKPSQTLLLLQEQQEDKPHAS